MIVFVNSLLRMKGAGVALAGVLFMCRAVT